MESRKSERSERIKTKEMMTLLRQTLAILGKELRVEWRTREIVYTMIFFGLVIVVIFGFGVFDRRGAADAAPGVLWAALLLAGTITLSRSFEREREGKCMTALALVPGIAWPLFLGKSIANLLFLLLTLAVVTPLTLFAFQMTGLERPFALIGALALGALGYTLLGTLVGGMISHIRMRAVLLPLVLFPLTIPLFGVGVIATRTMLRGEAMAVAFTVPQEAPESGKLSLQVEGEVFEVSFGTGDEPAQVAMALRRALAAGLQSAHWGKHLQLRESAQDSPTFILASPPGHPWVYRAQGLEVSPVETGGSGAGFLWILLSLDLLLLFVSGALFSRMMWATS